MSFLLAFIIISWEPVLVSYLVYRTSDRADAWSDIIVNILASGSSNTEYSAMVVAVMLAAFMLAGERDKSLNYLVSTPVSRREIVLAKYISGSLALTAIMLIISLFFLILGQLLPAQYSIQEVIQWFILTTAALLSLFSLALLVASFSRGILFSSLLTALILALPGMMISLTLQVLRQFYQVSAALEFKAHYIVTYLFIPDYIIRGGRYIQSSNSNLVINRINPDYPIEVGVLLIASFLFLGLAIEIFEKNPLERQGELLFFGNFKQIGMIFIAFLSAMVWAGQMAASLVLFLVYFLIMWLGIYLAMVNLIRLINLIRYGQV
jgi:ABC-type transport system involved in multi-copper enzyme maturation permease subunit